MSKQPDSNEQDTHQESLDTDKNPPHSTDQHNLSDEELLKKRLEELRKRDPFIYR